MFTLAALSLLVLARIEDVGKSVKASPAIERAVLVPVAVRIKESSSIPNWFTVETLFEMAV